VISGLLNGLPLPELVLQFESLGGGGKLNDNWGFGCEFGFFQREHGQEPLGLLRWASISPEDLIRALNAGFDTVGQQANTEITLDTNFSDWGCIDTRFNIRIDHTGLSRKDVSRLEARSIMCRRLVFLARKLVADLQAGQKIFVYRLIDRVIAEDAIGALAHSVNQFGDNILLFAALADEAHPPFSVTQLHRGLMIGYLDHFKVCNGKFLDWNHAGWGKLCQNVFLLRSATVLNTDPVRG
jgi:hypothetical protein